MANEEVKDILSSDTVPPQEDTAESFASVLSQYEKDRATRTQSESAQKDGVIVSISDESVFVDIGLKIEGVLSRAAFKDNADSLSPGDRLSVSIKGRSEEGYYSLSLAKVVQAADWTALEKAYEEKSSVVGVVTGVVKGGLTVDIGVRAFMPASRTGTRDASEMEGLVSQEITCRITKLDVAEEDVVVDRRVILEQQGRELEQKRYAEVSEGDVLTGQVRSLTSYGAFIDLGGVDGLLHISDMAWSRISSPEELLSVGETLQVKVLKLDQENKRISLGLKQLQPEPWDTAADRYPLGQRVKGVVKRLMDFGAFVEVEPGVEGLIHVSEMSWVEKVRKPGDILKLDDTVESVVLAIDPANKRLSLGLKQALGDPWSDVSSRFPAGTVIEGPVVRLAKFGVFIQLKQGVEGLVHISEIVSDKRLNHPQEALSMGEIVKAQVMALDAQKRQIKLSIKQMIPTQLDEFIASHTAGDKVSGRVVSQDASYVTVELGEGVFAVCPITESTASQEVEKNQAELDLTALTSMLNARWKGQMGPSSKTELLQIGQIRSFRVVSIDTAAKAITLELVK